MMLNQTQLDRLIIKTIASYDDELYNDLIAWDSNPYYQRKLPKDDKNKKTKTRPRQDQTEFYKYFNKFCMSTIL